MSRARAILAAAAAIAVPIVAVVEIAAHVAIARAVPTEAEWDHVADAVRAARQPGELVVVAPRWAEPHARARLGDDVMTLADLARADVSRHARAIEIDLDATSPDLAAFQERSRVDVGPFVVRHLDNPAAEPVLFDFVDAFGPHGVHVAATDPAAACVWADDAPLLAGGLGGHPTLPPSRFECPGGPFFSTAVTVIADASFLPRRCIFAHPFLRGDKVLTFDDVPLGHARRFVGHHGMYWMIERERAGAEVEIEMRVDGQTIGRARHADGDGWSAFSFAMPARPSDARGQVQLVVRTADARHRHYCVEGTLR